ncbi:CpaF family protein [Paenibacillus yanchengensis]|uniref:CpaF family protein n=1 Tax=Paenibacillus yanchengensis TaxID=2035833 RepID=A0ABW4YFM0_9BACL
MMNSHFHELRLQVRSKLQQHSTLSDEQLWAIIEGEIILHRDHVKWSATETFQLTHRLFHSFRGLDLLQPLLEDHTITEIMINNYDHIYIERNGIITRLPQQFDSSERLEDVIQMIVSGVNRIVNEMTPIVDARLKDGSRVHVVLPPIALRGPSVTIRKFPQHPLTMQQLLHSGSMTEQVAQLLQQLVLDRKNICISGGTGTGKTTFLNVLSQLIPSQERVITIEDSAELQLRSLSNVVALETRNANTEGKGEITIRQLIKAALRMRPDRIIIGEVRGAEAFDMLQALNTGHAGSLTSAHANSAQDMLSRLETMVLSAVELPIVVVRKQMASALDIIIHLIRLRDGTRKVAQISSVAGIEAGEIVLQPLYQWDKETDTGEDV